jgi:hypothetical protein
MHYVRVQRAAALFDRDTWMSEKFPFHRGERAVQERAGERILADQVGRIVSDTVISGVLARARHAAAARLGVS